MCVPGGGGVRACVCEWGARAFERACASVRVCVCVCVCPYVRVRLIRFDDEL